MISIRHATRNDLSFIVDFQCRLAEETEHITLDSDVLKLGVEALFDDPSKGVYYIAENKSEVTGCFMITFEWSDWRNGMVWWLQSVYVIESQRRNGVFRRMYEYITQAIEKDESACGLRLYVDKTNLRAKSVYSALGMNGDHYTIFEKMKTY